MNTLWKIRHFNVIIVSEQLGEHFSRYFSFPFSKTNISKFQFNLLSLSSYKSEKFWGPQVYQLSRLSSFTHCKINNVCLFSFIIFAAVLCCCCCCFFSTVGKCLWFTFLTTLWKVQTDRPAVVCSWLTVSCCV